MSEFVSLDIARAYLNSICGRLADLSGKPLFEALQRVESAYFEFPELLDEIPRRELTEGVGARENISGVDATLLLLYCIEIETDSDACVSALFAAINDSDNWDSFFSDLHFIFRSRQLGWDAIKPLLHDLRKANRRNVLLQLTSLVLESTALADQKAVCEFGSLLSYLVVPEALTGEDAASLAMTVLGAHRRMGWPVHNTSTPNTSTPRSRPALLSWADRLGRTDPAPAIRRDLDLAWPSGRLSFPEFALQWPCKIELPIHTDDKEFLTEAYQAILLRDPDSAEAEQYRRLREEGASRLWIIEDILASDELQRLGRTLRVTVGGQTITEPGIPQHEPPPMVTWPARQAI